MARSRGRAPPPRPVTQTRQASTVAAPRTVAAPPPPPTHAPSAHPPQPTAVAAPQQPGLFAQMATTAAGVAVGSAVGHTIGAGLTGLFSGSSSSSPAEVQQAPVAAAAPATTSQEPASRACEVDARNFTRCLDENNGNMQICDWYLQQLKACQQAAGQV
ncbi:uncharacterized protein SAPINGB_P003301 [Magnusiomyces paraingens]|uniref:CHCH domain-containing protein n=1 Tax=Magnusiomyces paraingens TaxID=2606893 RepID=A0A5E8BKD6_9ASCO|nr:uncharacterized protein SAPINGB_P003301 [Saprochaete ingens]VVT52052.1 unnamed protein product [Saprochaete ingens]